MGDTSRGLSEARQHSLLPRAPRVKELGFLTLIVNPRGRVSYCKPEIPGGLILTLIQICKPEREGSNSYCKPEREGF